MADGIWNCETLKAFIDERQVRNQEHFEAIRAAIAAAFECSNRAIIKAEAANEKRFESVNEFRQVLSDQSSNFVTRDEYTVRHKSLESKMELITNQLAAQQLQLTQMIATSAAKKEGIGTVNAILIAVVSTIAAAAAVATAVLKWNGVG